MCERLRAIESGILRHTSAEPKIPSNVEGLRMTCDDALNSFCECDRRESSMIFLKGRPAGRPYDVGK